MLGGVVLRRVDENRFCRVQILCCTILYCTVLYCTRNVRKAEAELHRGSTDSGFLD